MRESVIELLARVIGAILICAALSSCGLWLDDEAKIARARQAMTDGEFRAAVIDLKALLQKNPENIEARLLLGESSLNVGDFAAAEKEYARAIELGVPVDQIRAPLGRSMLGARKFDEALALVSGENGDVPQSVELLSIRGEALFGSQRFDEAAATFESVLEHDPTNVAAMVSSAAAYAANNEIDKALQSVRQAIDLEDEYAPAWLSLGGLQLQRNEFAEAESAFLSALAIARSSGRKNLTFRALGGAVEAQFGLNKLDAAREGSEEMLLLAPDNLAARLLSGRVELLADDPAAALEHFQAAQAIAPGYIPAQVLLGATNLRLGRLGQAEMYLNPVVTAEPENIQAVKLLAQVKLQQDKPDEVAETLRSAVQGNETDPQVLALLGQASLRAGEADDAVAYYEQRVANAPGDNARLMDLVVMYLRAGRPGDAQAALDRLPEDVGGLDQQRGVLAALIAHQNADFDGAASLLTGMLGNGAADTRIHLLLGENAVAAGNEDQARLAFKQALVLSPNNIAALLALAELDSRVGQNAAAAAGYRTALDHQPDNVVAMIGLARISERQRNLDEAIEWLERARNVSPSVVGPRIALARYHLLQRDTETALELAREVLVVAPRNVPALNLLGVAQLAKGDTRAAINSLSEAISLGAENSQLRVNLALAYLSENNDSKAIEVLNEALQAEPEALAASALLASLEIKAGELESALKRAEELARVHGNSTIPLELKGDAYFAGANWAAASEAYDQAMQRRLHRKLAIRAFQVRSNGKLPEPFEPLARWLRQSPDDLVARRALAFGYLAAGEYEGARDEYERLLEAAPEDSAVRNNLAWVYQELDDPRALQAAKDALATAPDDPAVNDTVGWVLVLNGEIQQGTELLRKALDQLPESGEVRYHLAYALAEAGDKAAARQVLDGFPPGGALMDDQEALRELKRRL